MAVPLTCSRILLSLCQSAEALLIPIKLRDFGYANSDALSVYGILTGMVFSTIMFPSGEPHNCVSFSVLCVPPDFCCAETGSASICFTTHWQVFMCAP